MIADIPHKRVLPLADSLHTWLLASCCFSCLLLLVRMIMADSPAYLFLPWNLFLAFIPYFITGIIKRDIRIIENKVLLVLALGLWLLFIPNSFYIVTDLFHLSSKGKGFSSAVPQWFDLLLIFSFAWNGMICGVVSLRRVEIILTAISRKNLSFLLIFMVMWLSAFGIYIGRFLRYNSWDIITDPFSLFAEIGNMLIHPLQNSYAWGMTLCYSVFMTIFYFTVKKLGELLK